MSTDRPVLIIGGSGYLGGRIVDALPGALALSDVAARGHTALRAAVEDLRPEVIVNAAGALRGDLADLKAANVDLPRQLAQISDFVGAHLVHLGSAAEYGTSQPNGWCTEAAEPRPESDYGRTKLQGTLAAASACSSTVLRVFNLAAEPTQSGTPLEDVITRTSDALNRQSPANLWSPGTIRDWVLPAFVIHSVARAVEIRPRGVFNVCSGVGVSFGDAVDSALRSLGSDLGVRAGRPPGGPVIGDPQQWESVSGLAEQVTTEVLAGVIARQASSRRPKMETR
ncbi:NAD-dependent epimerase/dehydratase family protein [Xylanimonas allomyrinae]|uniref:NAD-dependent epimerase/dehydratase family protein n=1 Tax=Xylanimonas allomyrinae TaxID=2509459 RepID=UPI0013A624EC|nr:NAD-dependent epimerase/dehydratase family protein [Xylanimonas allomyrinae]